MDARSAIRYISPWSDHCSAQARAPAGPVSPTGSSGTERSRRSSTANRPAASRSHLSPGTCLDTVLFSSRRWRSRKRSPLTFARTCAITSSASTCWARAIVRHYVADAPAMSDLRPPRPARPHRAPVPVEVGVGGKLLMTSGGYRSVSPSATVARFRKHVSPLTGVVSRLERIEADLPMNTNYLATHNFSSHPETVEELKAGLSGGSYGKGSTAEQGEASALMEAIERYSGIFQGDEIRVTRRFTDFAPGDAILPNDVLLFSDAQLQGVQSDAAALHDALAPQIQLDRSAQIEWSPAWSLRDERFKYLPTSILYFSYPGINQHSADSNGCAAGNTLEEAIVQGFLELVERDSYAIWWYNRSTAGRSGPQPVRRFLHPRPRVQLAETGRRLWVLDITSDLGIPSFVALTHWVEDSQDQIEFGSGAHFDPRIALLRAMTELNQFLSIGLMGGRSPEGLDYHGSGPPSPFRLKDHPYLTPGDSLVHQPYVASKFNELDKRDQVIACVHLAKKQGLDLLVLDQTRPDIEVPVVRVIVPGLRHFYRRFAPGRLYDVPVKLGLRDRLFPKNSSIHFTPGPDGRPRLRDSDIKRKRTRRAVPTIYPLGSTDTSRLKRTPGGKIFACFDHHFG